MPYRQGVHAVIISDLFCCPRSKEPLFQNKEDIRTENGEHVYRIVDDVPDFYVEDEISATPSDNANRKWLEAQAVEGRDIYYRHCHRQLEGMNFLMDEISRHSHSTCRVLEVGAGTGHFTRWLCEVCQPGTEIYACDYSWPCIETIKANTQNATGLHLFRGNARGDLPFAPEAFDIVLQRLSPLGPKGWSPVEKIQFTLDLLKPGGLFAFAGWEDEYGGTCETLIENGFASASHHRWRYPYTFNEEEYAGSLLEGGNDRDEIPAMVESAKAAGGLSVIKKEHLFLARKPE